MSYGKYGQKANFSSNDFTNIAYNDPWFALGHLLGANYSKNYNDRGDKKVLSEAGQELSFGGGGTVNGEDRQKVLDGMANNYVDEYGNAKESAVPPTISFNGSQAQNTPQAIQQTPTVTIGENTVTPYALNKPGQDGETISSNGGEPISDDSYRMAILNSLQNKYGENTITPQQAYGVVNNEVPSAFQLRRNSEIEELRKLRQEQAMQQAPTTPQISYGQNNVIAPVANGTEINSNASVANNDNSIQQLASQTPQIMEFDKNIWLANKRAGLMKAGYGADRIESLMPQLEAMATSYDNKVKENNTKVVMNDLLQKDENGQYVNYDITSPEFQAKIIELSKYSPEAANILAKNVVNGNQQWTNKQGIDKENRAYGRQQQAADNQLVRTKELYGFKNTMDRDNFVWKMGVKRKEEAQGMLEKAALVKKLMPKATDDQVAQVVLGMGKKSANAVLKDPNAISSEDMQNIRQAAITYGNSTSGMNTPDESAKKVLMNGIRKLANSGASREQIYQYFASFDNGLSTEELNGMLNQTSSVIGGFKEEGNNSNNVSDSPQQQSSTDTSSVDIDPATKNVQRVGWLAALQRNASAGDQRWSKEQMIEEARKRYGAYADELIDNTAWSEYGL